MQAIVIEAGRPVLKDVPQPKPEKDEVLIKVHLAGICGTDLEIVRGYSKFSGILGHEFVGTVVAGPSDLAGRRVVGEISCVCGRCDMCHSGLAKHCRRRTVAGVSGRAGVFAEFVTLPQRNCHVVPDSVSNEEAVFVEPLAAAYQIPRQVKLESKMQVAVLGTGRLGLLVAQVVAQAGCRLTALGRNPKTLGLLDRRRIRTANASETAPGREYDLVVDCTGSPEGLPLALGFVRPRGTIVLKTTCSARSPVDLSPVVVDEVTILGSRCGPFGDAINALVTKQVDVLSMITLQLTLSDGLMALEQAGQDDQIKVLLKVLE